MELGNNGFNLIKQFEGCKLNSYKCSAGVWTIGYGSTYYLDNTMVKENQSINQDQAENLYKKTLLSYVNCVNKLVKSKINQNQFDSLVSICYNIGCGNLGKSSLIKKVNINPNDPTISESFSLWNKAGGKVIRGLTTRRASEAKLYFKDEIV